MRARRDVVLAVLVVCACVRAWPTPLLEVGAPLVGAAPGDAGTRLRPDGTLKHWESQPLGDALGQFWRTRSRRPQAAPILPLFSHGSKFRYGSYATYSSRG